MYVQRNDGLFVLNPHYETDGFSYATSDLIVLVYIKNKDNLAKSMKNCFTTWEPPIFVNKTGDLNVYEVLLTGPIIVHSRDCLVTTEPVVDESLIFSVTVPSYEFVNSKKRSDLLKYFVLGSSRKSANFFKVVDEFFDKTEDNGLITLTRKK